MRDGARVKAELVHGWAVRSKEEKVFAPTCQVAFQVPFVTLSGKKEMDSIVTGPGRDADLRLGCASA